ncbi:MAG: RHS repeat-associated core domain-containing protein, partial [Terrimicrobiaceae bacterium]
VTQKKDNMMKKRKIGAGLSACGKRLGKLIAVAAAILAGATALPAAEKEDSLPGMGVQPAEYFFTGKPYDSDTESYTFKYRNYDPELNRWTTADPSGFPDGANSSAYCPIPTSGYDLQGLESKTINIDLNVATWSGAFLWSFEHGHERDGTSINDQPGFAGWTGVGLEMEIAGVKIGVGVLAEAKIIDNSNMETKMEGGVQWKRWQVDQQVQVWKKIMLLGQLYSEFVAGDDNTATGEWYE